MTRKLLRLTWVDSCAPSDSGWHREGELNLKELTCETVGWLISEDKTSISVACSVMENETLYGVITIPKVAILSRKTIRGN
jgi:hypothetical protein